MNLQELIKKCPKNIGEYYFILSTQSGETWTAGYEFYDSILDHFDGKTPEEAIEKLLANLPTI